MEQSQTVREELVLLGYPGALALFDYLESERKAGRVIKKIGSANLDLFGKTRGPEAEKHTFEEGLMIRAALPTYYFGTMDGSRAPIDDLMVFARLLAQHPKEKIEPLDQFCLDLTLSEEQFKIILSKAIIYEQVT